MSRADYALLQDVIMDTDFPDLDLALRRGRHVDRDDGAWYALLTDAQELLEPFYRRYGCELIHKTDGYFYLLPTGEKVSRKQLMATDMLVGQALALLYLDPAAVERGGAVTAEEVVGQLSAVLGTDTLIAAFNPGKRKSKDERIAQRNVRQRVAEAVRRLASLGFVEVSDGNSVRLRAALLRFAEPVRGLSEPAQALAKLVAQGEVALAPDEPGDELDEDGERASAAGNVGDSAEAGEPLEAIQDARLAGLIDAQDGDLEPAEASSEHADDLRAEASGLPFGVREFEARDETAVRRRPAAVGGDEKAAEAAELSGARLAQDALAADGVAEVGGSDSDELVRDDFAADGGDENSVEAGKLNNARLAQAEFAADGGDESLVEVGESSDIGLASAADGGDEDFAEAGESIGAGVARDGLAADGGGDGLTPGPGPDAEEDRELEWADILVPGAAKDGEDDA